MAVTSTSGAWGASYYEVDIASTIDDVDFSAAASIADTVAGPLAGSASPATGLATSTYAASFTSQFTNDAAETVTFYLGVVGEAALIIDGVEVMRLDSATATDAQLGPCAMLGTATCLCYTTQPYANDQVAVSLAPGEHTVELRFIEHPVSDGVSLDWGVEGIGRQPMDMTVPTPPIDVDPEGDGEWGAVLDWPLIPLHAMVLPDGTVFTFGTSAEGAQGAQFIYDVWDPITGEHTTLPNTTPTDIFCSQLVLDPATGDIMLFGGDGRNIVGPVNTGVSDVTLFDPKTYLLDTPNFELAEDRWYASALTLSNGEILIVGGLGADQGVASTFLEVYSPITGMRTLTTAEIPDMMEAWWYPHSFQRSDGKVVIIEGHGDDIYVLDATGTGSVQQVGKIPFESNKMDPSIMYDVDKVLMFDIHGGMWSVDLSGDAPSFTKVNQLVAGRTAANLTLLADGSVVITGGTDVDNAYAGQGSDYIDLVNAQYTALRWNPDSNQIFVLEDEAMARLYHSAAVVLQDGRVLSGGGGAPGPVDNLNAQVLTPDIYFDETGALAARPEILSDDQVIAAGETFTLKVSNAYDLVKVGAVKSGAVTHSTNSDARYVTLEFTIIDASTIEVSTPNVNVMNPGHWMVAVVNTAGVPSVSTMIGVNTVADLFEPATPEDYAPVVEDLAFEAIAVVRFDNLAGSSWQRVFDFGNGPGSDNILLTQEWFSTDMAFEVYAGTEIYRIVANDAIVEGEEATFRAVINTYGVMKLYKNDALVASGRGVVPPAVERTNKLIGDTNWPNEGPLIGAVTLFGVNETGAFTGVLEAPVVTDPAPVDPTPTDPPLDLATATLSFEAIAEVRFDNLAGGSWQRVFDYGNGAPSDNILLTQRAGSSDMAFDVYVGTTNYSITAADAIVEGETATFRAIVTDSGYMALYKNDVLIAEGQGAVPAAVERTSKLIGDTNWAGESALIGEVTLFGVNETGAFTGVLEAPVIPDPAPVDPTPTDPPLDLATATLSFEAIAEVRFDNLAGGSWQRVFDYGNGAPSDNILLTQRAGSSDMAFDVYVGTTNYSITAADAIVEGETATFRAIVTDSGYMALYKNDVLIAEGQGAVPAAVERTSKLIGDTNWAGESALIGEVTLFGVNETGAFTGVLEAPVIPDPAPVDPTPTDPPADPPLDLATATLSFEAIAEVRFDNLAGGSWQRVFDYGNGAPSDNILLTQRAGSSDMAFDVYVGATNYSITAADAIVEGETATFRAIVTDTGYMALYKNDVLIAEGQGAVPAAVERTSKLIGDTNWAGESALIGAVTLFGVNETGAFTGVLEAPVIPDPAPVDPTPTDPPLDLATATLSFEAIAEVRFDNLAGGVWQRVFDYGNGAPSDNILLTQRAGSSDMAFDVYVGTTNYSITAANAIIQGETATFRAIVTDGGYMALYKNDVLIAEGQGAVPAAVERTSKLIGDTNWAGESALIGAVTLFGVNETGAFTGVLEAPAIPDPAPVDPTPTDPPADPPLDLATATLSFEAIAEVRFDNLAGGSWQRVFDYGNGAPSDNILLTQRAGSSDMAFDVYVGATNYSITAANAIVEGETATFRAIVTDGGYMALYKNDLLIAAGQGAVPAAVERTSKLIGDTNWPGESPLIGEVTLFGVNETGAFTGVLEAPAIPDPAPVDPTPTDPPADPLTEEFGFEAVATVRFDDLAGGQWQRVFDYGNGPASDNILLTQKFNGADMAFDVYDGASIHSITAENAIVEGQTATFRAIVTVSGYMALYKDDVLVAGGQGVVPNAVVRSNKLVGDTNWPGESPLIGEVQAIALNETGAIEPAVGDSFAFGGGVYELLGVAPDIAAAEAMVAVSGGDLLSIESLAENDFVFDTFYTGQAIALDASDAAVEGVWTDGLGATLSYTNWAAGEPSSADPAADYAAMATADGEWAAMLADSAFVFDSAGVSTPSGFVVIAEYDLLV